MYNIYDPKCNLALMLNEISIEIQYRKKKLLATILDDWLKLVTLTSHFHIKIHSRDCSFHQPRCGSQGKLVENRKIYKARFRIKAIYRTEQIIRKITICLPRANIFQLFIAIFLQLANCYLFVKTIPWWYVLAAIHISNDYYWNRLVMFRLFRILKWHNLQMYIVHITEIIIKRSIQNCNTQILISQ